jgi:hypothetical protein
VVSVIQLIIKIQQFQTPTGQFLSRGCSQLVGDTTIWRWRRSYEEEVSGQRRGNVLSTMTILTQSCTHAKFNGRGGVLKKLNWFQAFNPAGTCSNPNAIAFTDLDDTVMTRDQIQCQEMNTSKAKS